MCPASLKSPIKPVKTINPASGEVIQAYTPMSSADLAVQLKRAEKRFQQSKSEPFSKRAVLLAALADQLEQGKSSFAELITKEMGKPLNQSLLEIEKCGFVCRYYQENGKGFLSPRRGPGSLVQYEPLGGVLGIMPWNFPFWQVFRFVVPALTAGNVVLLKHAENVWGSAEAIERLFLKSGWPKGTFTNLPIRTDQVPSVVAHPLVRAVSFTGSTKTGSLVAALAGQHLKKSLLELGGSDAYVVLKDADIEKAAESVVLSRFNNSGQSCIAAKRLIVEKERHDELMDAIKSRLKNFTISHPLKNPHVGPLAKKEFMFSLKRLLAKDMKAGARILYQKKPSLKEEKKGFYFPITLLGNCNEKMLCHREEVFGPLLPVFSVDSEAEALRLANATSFGLGAAVFTRDRKKGQKWIKDYFEAGSCFLNRRVRSHPSLPFGGIKKSGYGRELACEGLREFTNIKTLVF